METAQTIIDMERLEHHATLIVQAVYLKCAAEANQFQYFRQNAYIFMTLPKDPAFSTH